MIDVTCKECGGAVPRAASARAKYCSERCKRNSGRPGPGVQLWHSWKSRRKAKGLPYGPRMTPSVADLVQRDGLDCHVCLESIDYTLSAFDPASLTVDHLIPVADPRSFHALGNLKLAHLRCNVARGDSLHNDRTVAA